MTAVEPYEIRVPDEVLADLSSRLASTRWPDEVDGAGWEYGVDRTYLQELCGYWRNEFNWRDAEARLNELPHFRTEIDGFGIHFVHVRGAGERPLALVATHGWPSTFFELLKLIPLLTAAETGGDPIYDCFDLVIPSMPGYGFSDRPRERFVSVRVPAIWVELMTRLGYERFAAHGGDIGGGVAARLGQQFPEHLVGIHVTNVYGSVESGRPPTPAELAFVEQEQRWEQEEGAYEHLQRTRPQTLSHSLNDSPAGLAAWILEKYRAWSDCDGDLESVFTKDELLTNVTIYWATETISSSIRPYWDHHNNPARRPWAPITVPCGIARFPKDLTTPPREFAERSYNVQHWTEMPRGGHFPALEQAELLAADIRNFFSKLAG
jgi:pimeloyl-ACP methyl ester carboxylesterase